MSTFLDALFRPAAVTIDASHVLTVSPSTLAAGANYIFAAATPCSAALPDAIANAGKRLQVTFPVADNTLTAPSPGNFFVTDESWFTAGPLLHLPAGTYEVHAVYDPTVYAQGFWVLRSPSAAGAGLTLYPVDDFVDGTDEPRSQILIGKLNQLDTLSLDIETLMSLTLTASPAHTVHAGERFAIKVVQFVTSRTVELVATGGQTIESPLDATALTTLSIEALPGTYMEWVMGDADNWLVVGYLRGFAGA